MSLEPGVVIKVPVDFKQGEPKFLVIIDLDTEAHCLVINSKIHTLYSSDLCRDSIVTIDVNSHPFMHRDSQIDCNEVKRLPLEGVQEEINANADCLKGCISDDLRAKIVTAITVSPFLSPSEKQRYVGSIKGQ